MVTPAAEPSSYGTFDSLCTLVLSLAFLMLVVGAFLLLGAFVTAVADPTSSSDIAKMESKALASNLVSYGIACFSSGIPLLIFSYGGWIFLDVARNNRLQIQKTDEVLEHLAELNPKYEERLKREQEAVQYHAEAKAEAARRQAEKERLNQQTLSKWGAERDEIDRKRLAEDERQKALAAAAKEQDNQPQQRITDARNDAQIKFDQILAKAREASRLKQAGGGIVEIVQADQLIDKICEDIDRLFSRLTDIDHRLHVNLVKAIGDQFAQHESFKNLNINLEPSTMKNSERMSGRTLRRTKS